MIEQIDREILYDKDDGRKQYVVFTHIPSGTKISGWCNTFTMKDEYRLYNALLDLMDIEI